ncbi:hypothetical protein GCM10020366_33620 [Saccharopolyspora gregorii]|uniref:Uncharacterized protein n=1 Tax=Saccharopolyspora gregorii TaxID=33914 RepID=A0ABP6RTA7_9PSEU
MNGPFDQWNGTNGPFTWNEHDLRARVNGPFDQLEGTNGPFTPAAGEIVSVFGWVNGPLVR